jgi:rhodanese-related sulfurtransferase
MTYAGVREISPEWVAAHRDEIHVLDVRAAVELSGELGRLDGVLHIPLDELRMRACHVPTDRPILVLCQTGKRSALAAAMLQQAGVTRVANIAGGMMRWRELGFP